MSEVQHLEQQLEMSRELIKQRDAILRLQKNKDFRYIISELFLEKECAQYARISSNYSLTEQSRESALRMAQAAGHLDTFLNSKIMAGYQAEMTLPELESQILEAIREEVEDD